MKLKALDGDFSVCKIASAEGVDLAGELTVLAITDEEISLVCLTARVPAAATHAEHGFRALKICGVLDFALVGIIARIAGLLAENGIAVFIVSTYNTDYILIKSDQAVRAVQILSDGGYEIT